MKEYTFKKPVTLDGMPKERVSYRPLVVADIRRIGKSKQGSDEVRMVASACSLSPEDVENFGTRDFMALTRLIINTIDGDDIEDFAPDENDEIKVRLETPIESQEGKKIESLTIKELTTKQSLKAEKIAKGDQMETVFYRVLESCGLLASEMEKMSVRDYSRVTAAVAAFFTPAESIS